MSYYFIELKDREIIALHDVTSLDLVFSKSDGLLMEVTEQEYNILKACRGNISKGISTLKKIQIKMLDKEWES